MDQTPKKSAPIQVTQPAVLAMTFLERAKLKGIEVEYYAQTYNWLHSIVEGEFQVLTTELFESLRSTNTAKDVLIDELKQQVNELEADLEKEYGDLLDKVCELSDEERVHEIDVTTIGDEERVTISAIEEEEPQQDSNYEDEGRDPDPVVVHDQLEDVESEADDESE